MIDPVNRIRWDIDLFAKAWEFVTHFHAGQTYGGRTEGEQIPYINHLASVAAEVSWGLWTTPEADGNLAIQCALLHDTIEDTVASFYLIREHFGYDVASGVQALTKDTSIPMREAQMIDSLHRIQQQPKEIWMVKLADRIANLYHPPFYWNPGRINEYRKESALILESLGSSNQALASRLAGKITEYGRSYMPGTPRCEPHATK